MNATARVIKLLKELLCEEKKVSKTEKKIDLKSKIRRIPEFKGVVFWDITPLLKDKVCFHAAVKQLADHYRGKPIDVIVSNEARGFIIGAALAYELGVGFVPVRKKGKLPFKCVNLTYKKEYEMRHHRDPSRCH